MNGLQLNQLINDLPFILMSLGVEFGDYKQKKKALISQLNPNIAEFLLCNPKPFDKKYDEVCYDNKKIKELSLLLRDGENIEDYLMFDYLLIRAIRVFKKNGFSFYPNGNFVHCKPNQSYKDIELITRLKKMKLNTDVLECASYIAHHHLIVDFKKRGWYPETCMKDLKHPMVYTEYMVFLDTIESYITPQIFYQYANPFFLNNHSSDHLYIIDFSKWLDIPIERILTLERREFELVFNLYTEYKHVKKSEVIKNEESIPYYVIRQIGFFYKDDVLINKTDDIVYYYESNSFLYLYQKLEVNKNTNSIYLASKVLRKQDDPIPFIFNGAIHTRNKFDYEEDLKISKRLKAEGLSDEEIKIFLQYGQDVDLFIDFLKAGFNFLDKRYLPENPFKRIYTRRILESLMSGLITKEDIKEIEYLDNYLMLVKKGLNKDLARRFSDIFISEKNISYANSFLSNPSHFALANYLNLDKS